jgi:dihydrofolate reductase
MRRLTVFNLVSIDGYFCDNAGDMSWAHRAQNIQDPEWSAFVAGNAKGGGELLFGRVTYDMMPAYWPTPMAAQANGVVAERMNNGRKIVFSRKMKEATWSNTTLVKGDMCREVRRMRNEDGVGMAVLGSGTLVAQLAQEDLVDEYQLAVIPVVLGAGRSLFEGVTNAPKLVLAASRAFKNGNVLLTYGPA